MRIAVLSDIHSNMEALESVFRALGEEDIDRIVCLGDLVGYGPEPNECVEAVFGRTDRIVAGNHDCAASGRTSTENFTMHAKQAVRWTEKVITEASCRRLRGLPLSAVDQDALLVHATPDEPGAWHYMLESSDARRHFRFEGTDLCFTGHSHRPGAFVRNPEGEIGYRDAAELKLREGHAYIINVGSVGQPRDGDPRACFGIYDAGERSFTLGRADYPVERVQEKMERQGLPRFLIDRLRLGR